MTEPVDLTKWQTKALPPKLRAYLGLEPSGAEGSRLSEDEALALEGDILRFAAESPPNPSDLPDLLDELTALDLPKVAVTLYDHFHRTEHRQDFRVQLAVGACAMLLGALEEAEEHFVAAQSAMPQEPAPYVNLARLRFHDGRDDDAVAALRLGIKNAPDYVPLWLLYRQWVVQQRELDAPSHLIEFGRSVDSWLGQSMGLELDPKASELDKLQLCERLFAKGLRDKPFIVEYTACLGVAGRFADIPPIIWQLEKDGKALPWQAYVHELQAYLALEQFEQCRSRLAKVKGRPDLDPEAGQYLSHIGQELELSPPT